MSTLLTEVERKQPKEYRVNMSGVFDFDGDIVHCEMLEDVEGIPIRITRIGVGDTKTHIIPTDFASIERDGLKMFEELSYDAYRRLYKQEAEEWRQSLDEFLDSIS